jgi:hypothetical protein
MGIVKNQLIEELISDEDSEIDFVELSSDLEKWIVEEGKTPQHVIDEERGDMIRQRRKEQAQMEMYDDPFMNWSGLR